MAQIRVRFAPSPTGVLHVGGIRTALFNYFFAKSQNGVFILRNEDTDQARKVEGSLEGTMESLKWLGVEWDELVTQSERLDLYKKYSDELMSKGLASVDNGAVRFQTPKEGSTIWRDIIGNKEISFQNSEIEDFIILKADGFPTYHLANVIDDHLMEISHVIRGEDWIPSAPKHIMLYQALGWDVPVFAHVPNVLGNDGKKLSKRRGAKSVLDFKAEGFMPDTLLNYLMLLGWSPKEDREIFSKEEIINNFSLENVNSSPAIFDDRKLLWLNGEYIRKTHNSELITLLLQFDPELENYNQDLLVKLIEPAKTRMKTLVEFKKLVAPFVTTEFETPPSQAKETFKSLLEEINDWNLEIIVTKIKQMNSEKGFSFQDIYRAILGEPQGLPLADVFLILGKEKTIDFLS